MAEFRLETARLILREWREGDVAPFQAICSDPVVMATLGPPLNRERTDAITHAGNHRSRAVMERLGMVRHPGLDFDHPGLAADDPLLPHVTYSITADEWRTRG